MKYFTLSFIAVLFMLSSQAQTMVTFEELDPGTEGYWNGSDGSGRFKSGIFTFHNAFNHNYMAWSGFSYTNHTDTTEAGWGNQYSAIAGYGAGGSSVYATAYVFGSVRISLDYESTVDGMYVTNSTYAYLTMREGDDFSKKFGGISGDDPDYFRLLIYGVGSEGDTIGTVIFYLADFRAEESGDDYIIRDWTWVDLRPLGKVRELHFGLESTDTAAWGMNTPAYFCVDNINRMDLKSNNMHDMRPADIQVFPNPFRENFRIRLPEGEFIAELRDIRGSLVHTAVWSGNSEVHIHEAARLNPGLYLLTLRNRNGEIRTIKLQKMN